jgi:hypothetical protein
MAEKNEHAIAKGVIESLKVTNKRLKTKVRVRGQELMFRSEDIEANAIEMVRMCERIYALEIAQPAPGATEPAPGPTNRVNELESELFISQLARNELRMEFVRARQERTPYGVRRNAIGTKRVRSVHSSSKSCSNTTLPRSRLSMLYVHPDKNSNDPCADDKFKALNTAHEQFKEKEEPKSKYTRRSLCVIRFASIHT